MSIRYTGPEARLHAAEVFRLKWFWLVLMGAVLIVAGIVAIVVPAVSGVPANEVLGSVLVISGVVQIMQAAKMLNGAGFIWHLLLGIVAAIGGVLIYLDPFPGIVTITVVIAIIFAVHGATQIVFAVKVNRHPGWHWFLMSGCVALIVSALLLMKLPYGHSFTPATVAGISLAFGGWAYVALALASRKNEAPS
ncbi:MAG TPA: HdeD family acid-resistance protein [Reyranella sp.]